jgi:DNA polymerase-1
VGEPTAVQPLFDLPSAVTGRLVGLAFSPPEEAAFYLPLAGAGRTLDLGKVLPSLRRVFGDPNRPKVAHDVKTLWMLLQRHQIDLAKGAIFDTQLASFLVDPTKIIPHQLGQVVKEYLHRTLQPIKGVIGSGRKEKAFSEVDVERAGPYACHLCEAVAELRPLLERRVEEEGHHLHLREVELKLAFVLGKMELTGIRVDPDDLDGMGEELGQRLADYERRIHELAGKTFNIASPKQLSEVLFEDLGLPVIKRTKTGYSTNAEVLERLVPKHPIASLLLEYRKLAKLINTYTSVLKEAVNPQTGRIHASFQQTVGATGRLITTDPDLQRTPIRTPEGRRIRRTFIPAEGCKLISADWSQVELRLLAHFSGDAHLVESFRRGVDVHRRTAGQIFGCDPDSVSDAQRNVGKTVNYATIYGQGATSLGQILGVARSEAQHYIDSYFAAYSGVREWLDRTTRAAEQNGYVTTLLRRRRYIPELASNNPMTRQAGRRIAANTPIQGSAADICKLAMLGISLDFEAAELMTRMVLQIHDELLFEAPDVEVDSACRIIRERMETIYPLDVPLVVDIGVGMSWAEAH